MLWSTDHVGSTGVCVVNWWCLCGQFLVWCGQMVVLCGQLVVFCGCGRLCMLITNIDARKTNQEILQFTTYSLVIF